MPVKGNNGNSGKKGRSGRKSKAEEMGLQKLLDECWTVTERKDCIKNLAKNAKSGEMESVKLLMAYAYGKPVDRKEVAGDPNAPLTIRVVYDERL